MFFNCSEGVLITLEGGEGSGKSSVARYLYDALSQRGLSCLLVREPGATLLGERIRHLLLERGQMAIGAMSELLLFLAARAQNLEEQIRPALAHHRVVICDRYNDSSVAYQAGGRGLNEPLVTQLCELATGGLQPHLTLLLEVDPRVGCERAAKLNKGEDAMEQESLAFHQRVCKSYLKQAASTRRIISIDADQPLAKVQQQALEMILTALGDHALLASRLHPPQP